MGEYTNKTIGKAKTVMGRATRNRKLQGKGILQQTKGKVQGLGSKVRGKLASARSKVKKSAVRKSAKRPTSVRVTKRAGNRKVAKVSRRF